MRISDWSSDVCSSDLGRPRPEQPDREPREAEQQDRDADRFVQLVSREKFGAIVPLERPAERDLESEQQRDEPVRSEEHTSELQSLMRISYAVFCLKKKKNEKQRPSQNIEKRTQD